MTSQKIIDEMKSSIRLLKRGMVSAADAEAAMNRIIDTGVAQMDMTPDGRVNLTWKLHRRKWRLLLDATKAYGRASA